MAGIDRSHLFQRLRLVLVVDLEGHDGPVAPVGGVDEPAVDHLDLGAVLGDAVRALAPLAHRERVLQGGQAAEAAVGGVDGEAGHLEKKNSFLRGQFRDFIASLLPSS